MGEVAPFTGAWIETRFASRTGASGVVSRPSRARGLKHERMVGAEVRLDVAPFTGAWIETVMA